MPDGESLDLLSLSAGDNFCFGANGSKTFFLFPTEDDCQVIARDLENDVSHMDGSRLCASFMGFLPEFSDENSKGPVSEVLTGEDDSKPGAKPDFVKAHD